MIQFNQTAYESYLNTLSLSEVRSGVVNFAVAYANMLHEYADSVFDIFDGEGMIPVYESVSDPEYTASCLHDCYALHDLMRLHQNEVIRRAHRGRLIRKLNSHRLIEDVRRYKNEH